MPLVNFSNLDYDQIKTSIKEYIKSNSDFTDYDFEGSNLSTIIDVLAYNTYITSYNANMVSNEVFIDSATLRENVVSLARNIGYVPTSKKASTLNVSFFVNTSDYTTQPSLITLNKGVVANSLRFSSKNYTYSILDDITVSVSNKIAQFNNIKLYEGTYLTTNFTVDAYNPDQRFILPNAGIDTDTIRVVVKPTAGSNISRKYKKADSLFKVTSETPVYWVQEIENERYELIFGDGIFGKKLDAPNYIDVSYIVTNGADANGVSQLSFSGNLTSTREGTAIFNGISKISTTETATGGKSIEKLESVKKYASQIYSSQNRAVTANDYEAIIPTVYPETESISVFGGEELNPPCFGKVFISIKPTNGAYLSNTIKDNIKREIKPYAVAGIVPEIIDLKYLYIEPTINVYYNTNLAPSANSVNTLVSDNVEKYANSTAMNTFGARFKYSKFLNVIDESSDAVTSNITTITMRRDLRAALNSFAEYEICYGNRFHIKNPKGGYNIKSSGFNVAGMIDTLYLGDMPNSNQETGIVFLFKLNSPTEPQIVKNSIGTIDYLKGEIKLNPINITNTVINRGFPLIEISVPPYSNDVIGLQDLYLQLDMSNTSITTKVDNITSGYDPSGTDYLVSSSYTNGQFVR